MSGPWVITGAGIVSAAGDTLEEVAAALVRGQPLATLREHDGVLAVGIDDFDPKSRIGRKGVKDLSRASQLACAAATGIAVTLEGVAATDVGVVFGTAWGSFETVIEFDHQAHVQGPRFVDPFLFAETVSNIPAGQIAIFFGWSAFNATVSSGAASGLAALHRAVAFLEEGRGRVAIAGGGDALSVRLLRALRAQGSRLIGGEGACLLTVESAEHAVQRGAQALARIDAVMEVSRSSDLISKLLERAGLTPNDVDAIVLSASGERTVIDVFGAETSAPPVISPKAILGETWGASGALAVAVAVEIIRSGTVPGTPILRKAPRHVMVLDIAEHGQQLGIVLSAP